MGAPAYQGIERRERDGLRGALLETSRSVVISVGPWLFTIAALLIITKISLTFSSREVLADFRALLIYAFALSLIATAPVVITLSRILADIVYWDADEEIVSVVLPALPLAWAMSAILAFAVCLSVEAHIEVYLALIYASGIIGMTWVSLAACNALREFIDIALVFLLGLVVSVAGTLFAAAYGFSGPGMLVAFSAGVATIFAGLCARLFRRSRAPRFSLRTGMHAFTSRMGTYSLIGLGAFVGAVALWADKFVIWLGPTGERVPSGMVHAPLYDSAAFLASIAIIPPLAHFIRTLDTEYRSTYRSYYDAIGGHATLGEIERRSADLRTKTLRLLDRIVVQQVAISAIVVFLAPVIVSVVGLPFSGIPILRSCAIAAVFLLLFLAATSLLLFFDRHREFIALQIMFAALNIAGTAVTVVLGPDYYGLGFLVAAVWSGIAAYVVLSKFIDRLDYLTFVEGAMRQQRELLADSKGSAALGSVSWERV